MEKDSRFPNNKITQQDIKQFENIYPLKTELPVEIEIEKIADVKVKKINWIWKNVIAKGKLTLLAGEPGVGKSQLLLYIASIVSNGSKFHFSNENISQEKVLLISGEDDTDDTLKPRLLALNANIDNIHNVKGIKKIDKKGNSYYDAICLVEHIAELEEKIIQENYKLIIVDPISVYLGSVDENKNKEIRGALSMISALAARHEIGLLINSHFTKPSGSVAKNAIYRVMGSIGFAAAARIVYGVMKDPENPSRRLFIPIKNNIGDDKEGFAYEIKPSIVENGAETSYVSWLNEKIDKTANEILNSPSENSPSKLDEAKDFLKETLKFGSVALSEIRQKAEEKGISSNRLYKAKNELKIYETDSFGNKRGKIWMLP